MTQPKKTPEEKPQWLQTLLSLMEARHMSPRQLSLLAGLNPTAVRDMLTGRARYPRYDTLQALANVLGTTPSYLMEGAVTKDLINVGKKMPLDNLDLLTEIIARVQEIADDMQRELSPRELAAMATAIYRQILDSAPQHVSAAQVTTQAQTLVAYAQNSGQIMVKTR